MLTVPWMSVNEKRRYLTLCAEHAGVAIDYLVMAVPADGSGPFYWNGSAWTKVKRRGMRYTHLSVAKWAQVRAGNPPVGCTTALFELGKPGPKDWMPKRARRQGGPARGH